MNKRLIFLIPFTVFFVFHITWLMFRYMNWHWDADLNIPGFLMLMLAYPWNYLYGNQEIIRFLDDSIGYYGRGVIMGAYVSFGFAFNVLFVTFVGSTIRAKVLNKALEKSDAKNARLN